MFLKIQFPNYIAGVALNSLSKRQTKRIGLTSTPLCVPSDMSSGHAQQPTPDDWKCYSKKTLALPAKQNILRTFAKSRFTCNNH